MAIDINNKKESNNNENSIVTPIKTDVIPDRKDLNERKKPNKNTKRL